MLHQKLLLLCLSVISSTAFFHRSDKSKIVSPSNDLVSRSNNAALSNSCQGYQNLWATPILAIGNGGKGTKSCETHFSSGSDYAPVTGIESWLSNDGYRISGLRLIYATGAESPIYGNSVTKYSSDRLTLGPGEYFTECTLYDNGQSSQYLGHIHLATNKGQTFESGVSTKRKPTNVINVGGGILAGMQVSHGWNQNAIVNLAFLFLSQPIDHIEVGNVTFTQNPQDSVAGIAPNSQFGGVWYNNGSDSQQFSLSKTYSEQKSHSFTQATTSQYNLSQSVDFSASLPGLASASASSSTSWQLTQTNEQSYNDTSEKGVVCSTSGTVAPFAGINVTGTFQTGKHNFAYTSDVKVFLKGGMTYGYPETGTLQDLDYSECNVTKNTIDLASGAQNGTWLDTDSMEDTSGMGGMGSMGGTGGAGDTGDTEDTGDGSDFSTADDSDSS